MRPKYAQNLSSLEKKKHKASANDWMASVRALEDEYRAVRILSEFACALAGTPKPSARPRRVEVVAEDDKPALPPRLPARPRWSGDVRPGPHDVLTWQEALSIPWVEGEDAVLR